MDRKFEVGDIVNAELLGIVVRKPIQEIYDTHIRVNGSLYEPSELTLITPVEELPEGQDYKDQLTPWQRATFVIGDDLAADPGELTSDEITAQAIANGAIREMMKQHNRGRS